MAGGQALTITASTTRRGRSCLTSGPESSTVGPCVAASDSTSSRLRPVWSDRTCGADRSGRDPWVHDSRPLSARVVAVLLLGELMRIAFQGAAGAYSEAAAIRDWPQAETVGFETFEEVFGAVAAGRVSHGILPVENSIGGSIHRNYDLLLDHDLPIVGETELPVVHNLLALPGVT